MSRVNLEDVKERKYYGVPNDIAEEILNRNNTLDFSGFGTYTERSNENIIAVFHDNEFDFYRKGLMNIRR